MKVLIADDDDELRLLMSEYLSYAGFTVIDCENGKVAWDKLQKEGADIAVLDINMPEMDGLELLDNIRADAKLGELPVILITAGSNKVDYASATERGADDYLPKPLDYEVLIKHIKTLAEAFGKT